ncbi:hypothetical protein IFM89_033534 [Coptis chinensis]|uniref:Aminotransferase class V domain-containing protein n=1 Tax=Coptis chinensis TaxID=261450 RepID=A0A835LK51_9MAGN|nr:hypothetical protein IFM89_033534 [Coptis chinensis]
MVADVQSLDADFLVASSHKMCGPTGVGFLYGKSKVLSGMPPFLGLGAAIDYLSGIGMQKIHDYEYGVPIRSGHHCAQPLHRYLEINASVCASLHFYNTKDVDAFIRALKGTIDFFITVLSSFRAKKEKVEEIGELTELATYLHESLPTIPNVRIYGPVPQSIMEWLSGQVITALNLSTGTWELMQVHVLVSTSTTPKRMLMPSLQR